MTICVDANIVVRYVIELDDELRRTLMEGWMEAGERLVAPTLLRYEVTNALRQYQRARTRTKEIVAEALRFALALPIDVVSDDALHVAAL